MRASRILTRFIPVALIGLASGCESLPDLPDLMREAPAATVQAEPEAPVPAEHRPLPLEQPSRATIVAVQHVLTQNGYGAGPADGVLGPKTRAAIRRFQADNGLTVDGEISRTLLHELAVAADAPPSAEPGGAPRLDGARMPAYEVGDAYVYSSGRVETVAAIEGDRILWETNEGAAFSRHANFILPTLARESGSLIPVRSQGGEAASDLLWPLRTGAEVSFTARGTAATAMVGASGQAAEEWTCSVEGVETIAVPAGTFDTFRVACHHAPIAAGQQRERIWNYAPSIRHYVRRDDIHHGSRATRRLELVAIRLGGHGWPAAARAGLGWARDDALENKADGESLTWGSSAVDAAITITPITTFTDDEGARCRTYMMTRTGKAGDWLYPGMACRDEASGQWIIPGLETAERRALAKHSGKLPALSEE